MVPCPVCAWLKENYPDDYNRVLKERGLEDEHLHGRAAWLMLNELENLDNVIRQRDHLLTALAEASDADHPTEKEWRIMQRSWRGLLSYTGEE